MTEALGILEITGLTPTLAAVDAMEKRALVRILQCELNDFYGVATKVAGPVAAVHEAMAAGREIGARLGGRPVVTVLDRVDAEALRAIHAPREFNTLIEQDVVFFPHYEPTVTATSTEEHAMAQENFALGLIETQGFTAVFEAIDTACKAANVTVVGKEKLGGGYVTVIVKGDVAAVTTAIQAGQQRVGALGKLIAAHVIARPSQSVLGLLPR